MFGFYEVDDSSDGALGCTDNSNCQPGEMCFEQRCVQNECETIYP